MNSAVRQPPGAPPEAQGTPAARLLFATLHPADDPSSRERIRAAAAEVVDWPGLLRLAGRHEVAYQLHRGLGRSAADRPPPGILAVLEDLRRRQRERGSRAWGELSEVLSALAASGVPSMPFKGPVLARQLYGDVGARVSHDLDFLVRAVDVPRVLELLEGQGYAEPSSDALTPAQAEGTRRLYGELAYTRVGRLTIEPHWALAQSTQAIDLDCEAIWRRSRTVDLDGLTLAAPEPEDLFLMLVVHGSKEVWRKLKWVADVSALAASGRVADWESVLVRARAAGILRMIHVAWLLVARMTAIEMPEPIRQAFLEDFVGRRLAERLERRLAAGDVTPVRVDRLSGLRWRMRERAGDRLRYAWRTITTPRPVHYRSLRIPDRWIGMYVPLKIAYDYVAVPTLRLVRGGRAERASG